MIYFLRAIKAFVRHLPPSSIVVTYTLARGSARSDKKRGRCPPKLRRDAD